MSVPIACGLTASGARAQLAEWHDAFTGSAAGLSRTSPTTLSVRLRDDLAGVGELIQLARREQACCPFFEFTVQVAAAAVMLTIAVPEEEAAITVLDHFAELAGLTG